MGDVLAPGYSVDDIWRRQHPGFDRGYLPDPIPHTEGVRVGLLGISMRCTTCGTVCMAKHEPFLLTDTETGETRTVPGAWVGPPDDPQRHFFPFVEDRTIAQDNTDEHSATEQAPSKRPAGIAATAPRRSRDTPSRSSEARHAQYLRAKYRHRR